MQLTTLTALSIGFIAGFFCTSLIGRMVRLLLSILAKGAGAQAPFVSQRPLWAALPLLLLQPGLWILLAIPYICYLAYSGRISSTWGWAILGFFLSIAYLSALVFLAMRRAKRRRARVVGA